MGWGNGQDGCMRLTASTGRCLMQSLVWEWGKTRERRTTAPKVEDIRGLLLAVIFVSFNMQILKKV